MMATDQLEPDEPLKLIPDGSVGFCHYLFKAGMDTRMLKAEVKLAR
jgi:hypothetical protein